MKVLVACEYSGIVREAFTKKGHNVMSCDILETDIVGQHWRGDVTKILNMGWDLIIAHPPCTYLANSSVSRLTGEKAKPERWNYMREGAAFFKLFLDHPCKHVAIENPIMHKYAVDIVGRRQDQLIQPYQFGHPERKATCLWLKGLPKLEHTNNVKDVMDKLPKKEREANYYTSPGVNRAKLRSKTYQGIADAMANQWG